jgi:hypothetical protein
MHISSSDFDNLGEVDIIQTKWSRLTIRRCGDTYEVYIHWMDGGRNEVIYEGNLKKCVECTNKLAHAKDVVTENDYI